MWVSVIEFSLIKIFRVKILNSDNKSFVNFKFLVGFICFAFVPLALGESDRPTRLTYEHIYNTTKYAQIRPTRPIYEQNKQKSYVRTKNLLVGFAHDPFRYSVPEADYRRGVRVIEPQQHTNRTDRGKRGVSHLYNMLTCTTGCNPIDYKGYGCYCGLGGSGRPADGIDNCCRLHDQCYENIHCPFYTVYFQPYYWTCFNNEPLCALENFQNTYINGCAGRLCECDRRFAMCVRKYSCPVGRPLCRSSPFRLLQNILIVS